MAKINDSEQVLWNLWIDRRDRDAADQLLRLYMPLVQYHVQRISAGLPKNIDRGELHSQALFGLYDALEKFDRRRDLKFETYASFRIRGAILDGLRKEDWMPRSVREKSKRIERAAERIEQEKMGAATIEEVARMCGMSTDEVSQVMSEGLIANLVSLDDGSVQSGDGDGSPMMIEDRSADRPDRHLIEEENHRALAREIDRLSKNERTVVTLFYYEGLTLTEIGRILGLSTSRISQIHSKALFKLRKYLKKTD